ELELQLALGQALIGLEGAPSDTVREVFERAHELCFMLNDVRLLPKVYDGLVANYHYIRSNPDKITHYTNDMAAIYRRTGDPQLLLTMTRTGCLAHFLHGRFEAACNDMQKLIEMYDSTRDGPEAGIATRDPKTAMCTFLGVCLTILGYADTGAEK